MPQVDLQDLENRVYAKLDGNTQLYSKTSVDRLINQAARNLNLWTGYNQGSVDLGLTVANWQWYRTPSPVIFPLRVFLDNRPLRKSSASGAAVTDRRWIRGGSGSYTKSWVPVGTTMFGLTPVDPVGGKLITVLGVMTPALLVNPDDSLTLDDEYADLIVLDAFLGLVLKEGGKPFADASKGYQQWIKRARKLQRWESAVINPKYFVELPNKVEVPTPA